MTLQRLQRYYTNKFNRGEVDQLALARDDVTKVNHSGRLMCNFMPMRLGPMTYRPGTEYLGAVAAEAYLVPFVAATDDTAILEFSNNSLQIWVSDALIARTSVTTNIANGAFTSHLLSWTADDGSGATSSHDAGGYMSLVGSGVNAAKRYQTIHTTDTGSAHGMRVVIADAPVKVQVGTSGNGSYDLVNETLKPGTHCLKFTPGSNITITFSNTSNIEALVDSVAFDGAGTLTLPTSITTANLVTVRFSQSADVMFFTYDGGSPFVIERRGTESWSIVDYRVDDGPFGVINTTPVTMSATAMPAGVSMFITASEDYFVSTDVGMLMKLVSSGQDVSASVTAEDTGTNSIRVVGVDSSRQFNVNVSGFSGDTITLQRSTDDSTWVDVESYTTTQAKVYDDGLDNSILYYRLWCKTGNYSAGTVACSLEFAGGSITGIGRIVSYTSATVVIAQVLQAFGSTDATDDWYRGTWNATDGYPTSVSLYEGRLWWAGKTRGWGSVSDAYYSMDKTIDGASAAIQLAIGFGPVDNVEWLLPLGRLVAGIASDELSIRSNSFGDVLTPSNANIRPGSSQGAAPRDASHSGGRGYFVQRSIEKLYGLEYSPNQDLYESTDLTLLNPSICSPGIKRIAITMQPEVRVYAVLEDGTARVYLMDQTEQVAAWSRIETDGDIEDVIVLPATSEDRVYFIVNRTGGRYLEKMALFSEAKGGTTSKHTDSFVEYTSPGTTLTGLSHLEGKTVHVWADGQYRQSETVSSGSVTVSASWTSVIAGLRHTADWTSSVLHYTDYSVLCWEKRVVHTGLVMSNYWPGSIQIGPDDTNLSDMPLLEDGQAVDLTSTQALYTERPFTFDGTNETDPTIHLQATNPVTVMALVYDLEEQEDEESPMGDLSDYLQSRQ